MKNTKINEATKYSNQRISEAEGEKDAIISKAQGEKTSRIEQANGEVALFNNLYEEYRLNKEITRERLVFETLETVLPNAQIYIMNDDGSSTMKYLPLQQIQTNSSTTEKKEGGSTDGQ